ncbi:MAG TPA: methyltransferase domain-containing protein [Candidatus Binataceae bacterium]|nr:methyltransferase domain-containing protein [Candidatus Binataceae bacterium]
MERATRPLRRRGARAPAKGVLAPRSPIPPPLRLGPNLYLAHTMPGLEGVAAEEIAARYALATSHGGRADAPHTDNTARDSPRAFTVREIGRRSVPDRAGITIFTAPRPEPLGRLRTVEDIFAVVGYRDGLGGKPLTLERILAAARDAPYIAQGLAARSRLMPGVRAGHRLRYRVIARMAGEQEFRRIDLQRAVERGLGERGDHAWRLVEDSADVEFWATMLGDEFILALRLSDERMRQRDYKIAHLAGSLRPSVAAALGWLSRPAVDDIVLDPLCGAGTVLIERAHLERYQLLIGSDRDSAALEAARENTGPRYKPLELHPWDATALPLADGSVTKIVSNLPWGNRHGSHHENRRAYPRMLAEFQRLVRPGGRIVILTGETRLMSELIRRGAFRPEKILYVSILGAPAAVYAWTVAA